jgi:hypothetical protein
MASHCVRNRRLDTADEIMLATLGGSDHVSVCATGVGAPMLKTARYV